MRHSTIVPSQFIDRPNRFIDHAEVDGKIETVYVKNTGRRKELLLSDALVSTVPRWSNPQVSYVVKQNAPANPAPSPSVHGSIVIVPFSCRHA